MHTLTLLHTDIDERVSSIRDQHPDWLCRQGCDNCCRHLAAIPLITPQEWDWLRKGLAALPAERLTAISREIATLTQQAQRPIVCPLLDKAEGACLVYLHRPIACRTYGFYLQRGQGLYCKEIESRVTKGEWRDVVWGNQDVIDQRLSTQSDARELTEWFQEWSGH